MPPKRPSHKKTVSFSDSHSEPSSDKGSYTVMFSLKLVPVHLVLILYSLFTQDDLSPSKVPDLLLFHLYLLSGTQIYYTVIFNSSVLETRKGKDRIIRFQLAKEYHLLFIALIISALAVLPIYALLVAFGAPFTTYIRENILLAAHVSVLCYPTVVACLKFQSAKYSFYKYFASVAVGCWLGAIAIPLDWDRPWQNWPLPILGGAYGGAAVGYALCGYVA